MLQIGGDSADARGWDADAVQKRVADFIDTRVAPVAARRRERENPARTREPGANERRG